MSVDSSDIRLIPMTRARPCRRAAVFLHGLNGHCFRTWGRDGTPATFITRLATEVPGLATLVFDYPARLFGWATGSAALPAEIGERFAVSLEGLAKEYRELIVVGYCLGGTIATIALRDLDARRALPEAGTSVFLLDVPHDWREEAVVLSKSLGLSQEELREHASFWRAASLRPSGLRAYAITSRGVEWTHQRAADAGLPEECVARVDLAHDDLPRAPESGAFAPLDFVRDRLRRVDQPCAVESAQGCESTAPPT